jgi:hypothetical protein
MAETKAKSTIVWPKGRTMVEVTILYWLTFCEMSDAWFWQGGLSRQNHEGQTLPKTAKWRLF